MMIIEIIIIGVLWCANFFSDNRGGTRQATDVQRERQSERN